MEDAPGGPVAGCALVTALYVGSIYAFRPGGARNRNDAAEIWDRMVRITAASLAVLLLTCLERDARLGATLAALRVPGASPGAAAARGAGHVLLLYVGPLTMDVLDAWAAAEGPGPRRARAAAKGALANVLLGHGVVGWRDLADLRNVRTLAFGPVTEEFCFRACMLARFRALDGRAPPAAIAAVPLFFGLAHFTHAVELVAVHRVPRLRAVLATLPVFLYTYLFGCFAAYLHEACGSIAAPIAAHVAANLLGFPDFARMRRHPRSALLAAATAAGVGLFAASLRLR